MIPLLSCATRDAASHRHGRASGTNGCARQLKRETLTLYFACHLPRTSWYANTFAGAIVGYALSPIDLIPDLVPVLGYLDEVVLVPLGSRSPFRMTPGPRAWRVPRRSRAGRVRTNDANVLDPLAHRIASDAEIRVTFIATHRTVLGESDEDERTMENHATRPESCPRSRDGRTIASAFRIRSDRTLAEFRRALDGAGSPRLVLVREPDQLGVERAHPQLAFGVRLVELAEPNRHVAADNHRTPTSLDNDHLHAACVARRRDEPEPGKQLELAVDRHVPHAGRLDPLANGVVVLAARVVELPTLDVDRPAGEEVVAAAVVEVQVRVDDDVDAGEVEVLLAQWTEAGIEVGHRRVQLRQAGVDEHARIGMVDDVHVDRHPLALGEQVGNADWRDGD